MLLLVFGLTLSLSALLLFLVQPLVAKLLLPLLGGAPMVWNTCMVFFQALLLGGYAYAHWLSNRTSLRKQTVIHLSFLVFGLLCLPIALGQNTDPTGSEPFAWLLWTLFKLVGIPFWALSASAPLLQNWFSRSGHVAAKDPYFLYAASNIGSFAALLGYPLLVERFSALPSQRLGWSAGYILLLLCFLAVTARIWRWPASKSQPAVAEDRSVKTSWKQRGMWIVLSLIPSSLMLGVTTYLTTDIASVPLLWTLPLALYLVTFILVFSQRGARLVPFAARALPVGAVTLMLLLLGEIKYPALVILPLHLLIFFIIALALHGRLAAMRPPASQLTEFYLCMSIGGVLGGICNTLIAPLIFHSVWEYPLALVLACIMAPAPEGGTTVRLKSLKPLLWPLGLGTLTGVLAIVLPSLLKDAYQLTILLVFGIPLLMAFFLSRRPLIFGLALWTILMGGFFYTDLHGQILHAERNFFGALRVTLEPHGNLRRFYHGTTIHGVQFIAPEKQYLPLAYYHPDGPMGQIMHLYHAQPTVHRVAIVGLGAGALAAYARPDEEWTFYEIDPAVLRIASDTNYFTYLHQCRAGKVTYKLGDARLNLKKEPDGYFDMIICDAFSSDVPPLHLITEEAMELYRSKLAPGGIIAFNISSRLLSFRPVLGNIIHDLRMSGTSLNEGVTEEDSIRFGRYSSHWAVIAEQAKTIAPLSPKMHWVSLTPDPSQRVWTDDYSNILGIVDWKD